ncbi:hypothetical protein BDQ17DRAFT_1341548 [Cyathus striatus]|nr:hypothetical protein BDQ17DRAFT_1341548 [Cyathus striatus]
MEETNTPAREVEEGKSSSEPQSILALPPLSAASPPPALAFPIQHSLLNVLSASPSLDLTLSMKSRTPIPDIQRPLTGDPALSNLQQHSPDSGRPLNVTDALSYLDAVKIQFAEKPEVYNQFLDIMKDFKSQVIDTPGVISRVSKLFHGNPYLIQGFNTFLPMGYRIDISTDPNDTIITVTTPLGTTTHNTNNPNGLPRTGRDMIGLTPQPNPPLMYPAGAPILPNLPGAPLSHRRCRVLLGNLNNKNPAVEQKPQEEFNHAIQYLNKIKARYADDPNMYKQFLDILQAYQKEQRHVHDSQVYVQVQVLFKDAPDLLAEFKDFLPEAHGATRTSGTSFGKSAKKPVQASKRKKKRQKKSLPLSLAKHHHIQETGSPSFSPFVDAHSPQLQQAHVYQTAPSQGLPIQQQLAHVPSHLGSSADKLLFFDRAKKSLESKEIYEEFLKLLSLFSKEIIDVNTLVERSHVFLNEGELMTEFKELVGWEDKQDSIENGPPGSIPLPVDDGEGPSYRRLPDSEIRLACSGRDELCRSVLNDEWVSHPTWASEEAGFVAHKKNSFEEALHKSEEERHEYHVHLEALSRTISLFDPLNARIEEMNNEERSAFKLKPDFGGKSKTIYHRIIKKIFGRDNGAEIINALQECPSVAVPVVLARLKQKDEEWRRAQREWSKTWREVDSKNFYKSLDHQGISFKQNDKKNITAKHFVSDIETIRNQQISAWEQEETQTFSRGSVGHQLEYAFHDTSVLLDSLKLVFSFLDHSQAHYSPQERRVVEKFLRAFVPILCMYPTAEFNAACAQIDSGHDEDIHEADGHMEGSRSGRRSIGSTHSGHSNGVPANDLRIKLLRAAQDRATKKDGRGSTSAVGSRATSPSSENRLPAPTEQDGLDSRDIWIKESRPSNQEESIASGLKREQPFFANTTFYTLLRLLQLLYSRLLMGKEIGAELAAQKHASLLANPVAVDLGLDDPNGPSTVLTQSIEALGDQVANEGANVVYMYLLNACEKCFGGEMEQLVLEEHMRWFFGNKAYHLFTLDKLITALVKQVQTVLSDNKCQELWSLLQGARNSDTITNQDMVRYRREAERHVGQDDHLYRIQWVRESKTIRVCLMGPDEPSVEADGSARSRWQAYIDTYVLTYPTEWLPAKKKGSSPVFLRSGGGGPGGRQDNQMKIRVNLPTYKLVYEDGCEDMVWRGRGRGEERELRDRARARDEERKRSRWICV